MMIDQFSEFYRAIHGRDPFPWQQKLAALVISDGWPKEGIAIATAGGKTTVLDIAVFRLALEAGRSDRRAALRTFFVIDRRVVVDEAAQHAARIAEALETSPDGILREAAGRLRSLGGDRPLRVAVLRGGMYRDQTWADYPDQPLLCVSTVDQIGSRLLFRGYQLSQSQRPVHAALTGMDSLIILDEAHLSLAFAETVGAVRKYQQWAETPPVRGVELVRMSATNAEPAAFRHTAEDERDPELERRWSARKLVRLQEPARFEEEAAKVALSLQRTRTRGVNVIGVVVNRVGSARTIFNLLKARTSSGAILLTGRVRPYDRDRLLEEFLPRMKAGRNRAQDTPLFVVATQTVEVGANLDFDALVSEAAPLDALRQRFGRLDRLGELGETHGVLLLRKGALDGPDAIYGDGLHHTWTWLSALAQEQDGRVDFGVSRMDHSLSGADTVSLYSRGQSAPLLFPAHLESWVQTNPAPAPDPDVAPFLHGPDALQATDVQIVWRADLDPADTAEWERIVLAAPPVTREALAVPFISAKKWLENRPPADVADVEGAAADGEDDDSNLSQTQPFVTWMGAERVDVTGRLIPGTTIIVPSVYGGCDRFGWFPEMTEAVTDIGDLCWNEAADAGLKRHRLRLHANLLFREPDGQWAALLERMRAAEDDGDSMAGIREELMEYLRSSLEDLPVQKALKAIGAVKPRRYCEQGYLVTALRKTAGAVTPQLAIREFRNEETDDDDSASFTRAVTLASHTAGVAKTATDFARHAGLSPELADALESAAELHDLGKCDERFQALLHGGSLAHAMAAPEALAKSAPVYAGVAQYRLARELAKYPEGARHEFTSVALAEASGRINGEARDLILHLIGAHHGYGRPLPPSWQEDEAVEVTAAVEGETVRVSSRHGLGELGSGWMDRFWLLNRRYGYWGLAYLEMILRRADCVQSRREQESV
jgi:CRISPR-associated endonuclease/helicase Cas3